MLLRKFNEPGYLEKLTGLNKLHGEDKAVLESVDWDEDNDRGGVLMIEERNLKCMDIGVVVCDM
jgi:hypothetical protein